MGKKRKWGKTPKNKKVKNATRLEVDGLKFKSKLEAFAYRHLKARGIKAEYEQTSYTLITPFEYKGEKIRACTYTPDFVGDGFVIEIKGYANDVFPLKWKMFKQFLSRLPLDKQPILYLPKNQKEVLAVLDEIVSKNL